MQYDLVHQLARQLSESEEVRTYKSFQEAVDADETSKTLLKEMKKLQTTLQMTAMAGQTPDSEMMSRFSQLSALLYSQPTVAGYLTAEIRVQQMMSDVFKILTDATGLSVELPGME